MCGFVGICHHRRPESLPIESLLDVIRHRGPDRSSFYEDSGGRLRIGFARLAIIDLETGDQPVKNEDGGIIAVLNGEIYNYVELTEELRRKGHRFSSHGDAETIVHLYEEHGDALLDYLEGMFSLALWDERKGRLLIARDPVGIKPLYYASSTERIAFASEVKPLLHLPGVSKEADPVALEQYLAYQYTLAPRTFFRDIRKLPAGHKLVVEGGTVRQEAYWRPRAPARPHPRGNEVRARTLAAIDDSVRLHLRSDVPVGAFLSGGIDSGLMVALAARRLPRLKTYTLRFADSGLDESALAAQVAQRYATDHRLFTVEAKSMTELIPRAVWACDEPLGDSGLLPNYVISELAARDGVKVVLGGAGGDELFAGYTYYFPNERENRILRHPVLAAGAAAALDVLHPEAARKVRRALAFASDPLEHYLGHVTHWSGAEAEAILAPSFRRIDPDRTRQDYWKDFGGKGLNAKLFADLKTYLTDDILLLMDRMTMIHSIEGRVPYVHKPLVEFALGLGEEEKAPGGRRKGLLQDVARPFLPEELFHQKKSGFNAPVQDWVAGPFGENMIRLLRGERSLGRPWWNRRGLETFLSAPQARGRWQHRLFMLFMLEVYCRIHIDNSFSDAGAVGGLADLL